MPKAVVDTSKTETFELKSLPEGFVVLRRLTYGQMLHRQEMAAEMGVKGDGGRRNASPEATIKMMQTLVTQYEFANCIVDHNLEDANGNKLSFQDPAVFNYLDPQVGDEISQLIDSLNQFQSLDLSNSGSGVS